MSPSLIRSLFVISICTILVTIGSVGASRQQAGAALRVPDKSGITPAEVITVNSASDAASGTDGLCTLRQAIIAANNNAASGAVAGECVAGSSSGSDVIDLTGVTGTITLTDILPDITSDLTINGPGADLLIVSGNNATRVLKVQNNGTAAIANLTIANGLTTSITPGGGGGIQNFGSLSLTNCNLYGNVSVGDQAGAILMNGTSLNLTNCNVGGPSSGQPNSGTRGAGIFIFQGTMNINGSLIANNTSSGSGGGVYVNGGTVTISNSTVSGNTCQDGGGFYIDQGSLTLNNVAITNNRATSSGGGLTQLTAGIATLNNVIVWGNFKGASTSTTASDIIAAPNIGLSGSFNLVGTSNASNPGFQNGVNNNQIGVSNARLGPLASNGGTTQTHLLLAGSPALDAGSNTLANNAGLTLDQRGTGFARIVDGPDADTTDTVDIGAFEANVGVEDIPDKLTNEDTQIQFTFNVGGAVTSVTATSSNTLVVPNAPANIAVSGSGSTRTLTINPAAEQFGSTTITVTANGSGGSSMTDNFVLTVRSLPETPSVTNATTSEDIQNTSGLVITRNPADPPSEVPNFKIINITNGTLFKNNGSTVINNGDFITSAEGNAGLRFTPAANLFSPSTTFSFQVYASTSASGDALSSDAATATIIVNSANDPPSFTKGPNQVVNEDAGAQSVNNWATNISSGPPDESAQTIAFQIIGNTNAALFSSGPAISSTGTLTYTPAADANGSATITVNLKDDGGTANGGVDTSASQTFIITVNSVNDAPSFTKGADETVSNNAGAQTVTNWGTAISAGPANESGQILTFQVTSNTNPIIFSVAPAISANGTLTYTPAANGGGTTTITIVLKDNGGTANGGVDTSISQSFNITVIPVGGFINFSAATNNTTESSGFTTVTVKRTGDLTRAVTVDYASSADNGLPCSTANGVATPKCDFTAALGTVSFAAGEDTKVVNILISQDGFVEGPETFTVSLSNPTNNAALGTPATSTTTIADDATEPAPPSNVIDDARNFVRQHYHDFLNREPDQSGWDFWTNQITSCGSDLQCNEVKRIDVSASFFLSIEFQQTGYLVERFYKVGYADATGNSTFPNPHTLAVPIVRANEFLTDTQRIGRGVVVLAPGWEQALENNKQAYALEFIQTARFISALPTTMTPAQFVTKLNQNAGGVLTLTEQQTAINLFGGAGNTTNQTARSQAVRMVAEDQDLYNAEFNRAFVLTQYFGYLRRNPNDAPDNDYTGYDFWLTKLNQFNGNYINAEMVKAFLSSIEYRQRFGP